MVEVLGFFFGHFDRDEPTCSGISTTFTGTSYVLRFRYVKKYGYKPTNKMFIDFFGKKCPLFLPQKCPTSSNAIQSSPKGSIPKGEALYPIENSINKKTLISTYSLQAGAVAFSLKGIKISVPRPMLSSGNFFRADNSCASMGILKINNKKEIRDIVFVCIINKNDLL